MMIIIKVIKIILVLPICLILAIFGTVLFIKAEFFNEDMVEYEMKKYNNGEEYLVDEISKYITDFLGNNKPFVYIINTIIWIYIIYLSY